jgi:hypothetical protein
MVRAWLPVIVTLDADVFKIAFAAAWSAPPIVLTVVAVSVADFVESITSVEIPLVIAKAWSVAAVFVAVMSTPVPNSSSLSVCPGNAPEAEIVAAPVVSLVSAVILSTSLVAALLIVRLEFVAAVFPPVR